jgi:hypothetical protein
VIDEKLFLHQEKAELISDNIMSVLSSKWVSAIVHQINVQPSCFDNAVWR